MIDETPVHGWRRIPAQIAALGALLSATVLWAPLGNVAAYFVIVLALLGALFGWSNAVARSLIKQRWLQMFVAGFALLTIAFLFNADPNDNVFIWDFLPVPLAFFFAMSFHSLRGKIGSVGFAWLCLIGAFAAALVGSYEVFLLGETRATGLSNSPIHFADYAVIFGFMALGGTFLDGVRHKWVFYAGPVLGLYASTMAASRWAFFVAVALAALFGLFLFRNWRARTSTKIALIAALIILPIVAVVIGNYAGFTRPYNTLLVMRDILSGQPIADTSSAYRVEMYSAGIRAFLNAPLFGHSWNGQVAAAMPYLSELGKQGYAAEGWAYLHNDLLGFAVAGGVIAIATYLLWLAAPIVGAWSSPAGSERQVQIYLTATFVFGLFLSGCTDVLFMSELSKTLLASLTAAIVMLCGPKAAVRK